MGDPDGAKALAEGMSAHARGEGLDACPHDQGTLAAEMWVAGWKEANGDPDRGAGEVENIEGA